MTNPSIEMVINLLGNPIRINSATDRYGVPENGCDGVGDRETGDYPLFFIVLICKETIVSIISARFFSGDGRIRSPVDFNRYRKYTEATSHIIM